MKSITALLAALLVGPVVFAQAPDYDAILQRMAASFAKMDKDGDKMLTEDEFNPARGTKNEKGKARTELFNRLDANNDMKLSLAEFQAPVVQRKNNSKQP